MEGIKKSLKQGCATIVAIIFDGEFDNVKTYRVFYLKNGLVLHRSSAAPSRKQNNFEM